MFFNVKNTIFAPPSLKLHQTTLESPPHHPRPSVATTSRCCLPSNHHTKKNVLSRVLSSKSTLRI
ncbi:hypothetical protein HKD37_05G012950 [Glycine soja]